MARYVLIAQDEVRAEFFVRQGDDPWLISEATDLGASLEMPVVDDVELPLAEVYDRVPGLYAE